MRHMTLCFAFGKQILILTRIRPPSSPTWGLCTSLRIHSTVSLPYGYERQSARMSKITNDGLTRSGTGCFIAVPVWQQ